MAYSLAAAAAATGLNKTTVLRAIKAGRITGTRDDFGQWLVEPAELHRVYPPVESSAAPSPKIAAAPQYAPPAAAALEEQIKGLRDTADLLRAQLDDVKADRDDVRKDRDHWRDQAQAITRQLADHRPATFMRWLRRA